MEAELFNVYQVIGYGILAAAGLYFLRAILTILLKRRVAPGLAPGLDASDSQTFFPRVLSLVGLNARPTTSLNRTELRTTLGIQALCWALTLAIIPIAISMNARLVGPESLLFVLALVNAVQMTSYRITYDKTEVTLPRWWFGSTTRPWRKLVAITDKDPYFYTFHFADETRVKVHKYIVGHAEFMAVARGAIRNS
jgi:hypothetical protein